MFFATSSTGVLVRFNSLVQKIRNAVLLRNTLTGAKRAVQDRVCERLFTRLERLYDSLRDEYVAAKRDGSASGLLTGNTIPGLEWLEDDETRKLVYGMRRLSGSGAIQASNAIRPNNGTDGRKPVGSVQRAKGKERPKETFSFKEAGYRGAVRD